MMLYRIICVFLLLLPACLPADAQSYPRNYFRHPLDIRMELVGNFGEIRTNHWHMGLDIRTQQRVGLPVYASAEGYIARVVVEPGGFGQAIYINHPNGYTTLYAHMNSFYPALDQYVRERQHELESWRVNLYPPAGMFPVKKGEFIGRSGTTGGSAGPHVHFEIRDTRTEKVLNPLLFGFPVPDAVPPVISRLAMYDRSRSTYDQSPQMLSIRRSGSSYTLTAPGLRVGSRAISFAIGAVDMFSGSNNPNGIYSARISMDGNPVSEFVLDSIRYDESRYLNAQLDYPYKSRGGVNLQHLTPLPGARHIAYTLFNGDGIIRLEDEDEHQLLIEVLDANRNKSTIRFTVRYDPRLARSYISPDGERLVPGRANHFTATGFELRTTSFSIYDTARISYASSPGTGSGSVSAVHSFLDASIPVHDSVVVRIKPATDLTPEQGARVIIRNISGNRTVVQRARWENGWLVASFRQLGTFQAFVDEQPPSVNAPPADLTKASRLAFTPTDNFNSIRSFRAELNGKWLRFTNDKGRTWLYSFDRHFPRGTHQLRLVIEDEAGNKLDRTWTVRR